MTKTDPVRTERLLNRFIEKNITTIEADEYRLRIIFENGFHFVSDSPWRVTCAGELVIGSGDIGTKTTAPLEALESMKGHKVVSVSISDSGDTRLRFDEHYLLEIFSNSLRYETWEAHLDGQWFIFAGGEIVSFPPSGRSVDNF